MSYKLIATPKFKKSLKKIAKKHPSIKSDLAILFESLEINPEQGVALGNNCYKVRLAIKSKGKGKSGGARLITYVLISKSTVYLISIFDKTNKANLTDKELKDLLKGIS